MSSELDLDSCIARLLSYQADSSRPVSVDELSLICAEAKRVLLEQPPLLELAAPISVVGDVHGQFLDLVKLFQFTGPPPESNYLFLGDYVDRGPNGLEVTALLLCLKLRYPQNFFMLRGNHEASPINRIYGFYEECKRKYNFKTWKEINNVFDCLPFVAIIEEKILCVHAGLSPELASLEQLRNIPRPIEIPDAGLLCDLLWSDPDPDQKGWGESDRGVSFTFGPDVVTKFLARVNLDLICRAHQVVEDGYEFFSKRQLVTVFSAPNYCGEFDNAGAVMAVDVNLRCSFHVLKPRDLRKVQEERSKALLAAMAAR